jgi:GT2 family glycosyltransferase
MNTLAPDSRLSVVVCTHNRAAFAIDCVESLLRSPGAQSLEIIVVDNASSSEHREQLEASIQSPVRLVSESKPGISHARNLGASIAGGTWLAYLDDDALPYPDWTECALKLVERTSDTVGLIGGAVLPKWPVQVGRDSVHPERLGNRWRTLLSLIETERLGPGTRVPDIVACNMLVRRALLQEIGGFPTQLGRTPGSLLGGEEIAVARGVAARGARVVFEPRLRVHHRIHVERLGTDWVRRRAHAEGELLWKCSRSATTTAKVVLSIPYLALVSRLRALPHGRPPNYDYHVRLWNNLGFVKSAIHSVTPNPHRGGGAA